MIAFASQGARSQELVQSASATVEASRPDSPAQLRALVSEARTLMRFDTNRAYERAEAAERLAERLGDRVSLALALAIQAQTAARSRGPDIARDAMARARSTLPGSAHAAARAEVMLAAARLHWVHDEQTECITALREALDLATAVDAKHWIVKANILALGAVGWPEQAEVEMARLLEMARAADDASLVLECRVLLTTVKFQQGTLEDADQQFDTLLEDAIRLGDRSLQCYLENRHARSFAPDHLERALTEIGTAIATAERQGDREQLALAYDYAARLQLHLGRLPEGVASSRKAIEAIQGLEMLDREITVFGTAAHIALQAGETDAAQQYNRHVTSLQQQLDKRTPPSQRARLWQQANALSSKLRTTNEDFRRKLDEVTDREQRALIIGFTIFAVVLAAASALLLRDRKRLRTSNEQLARALDDANVLQAERTALKENLQQIERLDSIGLLAGGFAHDFNNILVSVRGNTQLALTTPETTDLQRELLEQVLLASDRAAGLCKDILNYANSQPSPKKTLDVRDAIEGMVPLARSGFGSRIELVMDLGAEAALVQADQTQIEQVILNILVNAGDAISAQGKIRISIDERKLDGSPPTGHWFGEFDGVEREYIAISVLDNGQGMNSDTIRRIFDPFFSTRFAGRGLGLAAAFGILRAHNGIVEVYSEVGHGTQFTVYLPKHHRSADADDDASGSDPEQIAMIPRPVTPSTILVVDDEPSICDVVRGALEVDGHNVITAHQGTDALELAEENSDRIALAVLDVTMPGMDGPTLASHLQKKVPGLPTVMMTGHAESAVRTVESDSELLLKPFDLQALRNTINSQLRAPVSAN